MLETTTRLSKKISVRSPARIHCALLNESGVFHRVDSGVGFALCDPFWELELSTQQAALSTQSLPAEHRDTVVFVLERFKAELKHRCDISVSIRSTIPLHIGLGSKTSLVMGLGWAICKLLGLSWDAPRIATFLGRGGTSGIGAHALSGGGFIWDAGRRFPEIKHQFGPSSERLAPAPQKILSFLPGGIHVVHFRFAEQGVFGFEESELFRRTCPTRTEDTIRALSLLSGSLIPSLVDQDDQGTQFAIGELQKVGLKLAEWQSQADETLRFRELWLKKVPDIALGLSSAGPTMYCVTRDVDRVKSIVASYHVPPIHMTTSKVYAGFDRRGRN